MSEFELALIFVLQDTLFMFSLHFILIYLFILFILPFFIYMLHTRSSSEASLNSVLQDTLFSLHFILTYLFILFIYYFYISNIEGSSSEANEKGKKI